MFISFINFLFVSYLLVIKFVLYLPHVTHTAFLISVSAIKPPYQSTANLLRNMLHTQVCKNPLVRIQYNGPERTC